MSHISKIQYSKDYDNFKFYESNRKTSNEFIQKLVDDPTFIRKYTLSPIVVSKNLSIIDGQHRFKACRIIGLPIAYIIDDTANEEDIKIRNMQQNNWKGSNFLDFYACSNSDYKIIKDLKEKYHINMTILGSAIKKICGYGNIEFHYGFKKGLLSLGKNKDKFIGFINEYVSAIKYVRSVKGYEISRPYFTDPVVIGFCHYYLTNKKMFDKAISKMAISSYPFPFCKSYENARVAVGKLVIHQEKKESSD